MATRKITLTDLPPELLVYKILSDSSLTNQDRKNVRLACRALEPSASAIVFKRIFISRLKADRDAFLNVASTPRLAVNVQEVVWYELGCDGRAFRNIADMDTDFDGGDDEEAHYHLARLADATAQLCWLPAPGPFLTTKEAKDSKPHGGAEHHDGMTPLKHHLIILAFQKELQECIQGMPRLDTFMSVPMPPNRKIFASEGGYDIEVGMMKAHAVELAPDASTAEINALRDVPAVYHDHATNEGLSRLLLPVMKAVPGKITKLRWLEDPSGPSKMYELARAPTALAHLTFIDLSINAAWLSPDFPFEETVAALEASLKAAPRLQKLRLALDCAPDRLQGGSRARLPPSFLAGGSKAGGGCHPVWRDLRCLSVTNVDRPDAWLLPLLGAHAATLRELHLHHCSFTGFIARRLARVPRLALDALSFSWHGAAVWDIPGPVVADEPELLLRVWRRGTVYAGSAAEVARLLARIELPLAMEVLADEYNDGSFYPAGESDGEEADDSSGREDFIVQDVALW